MCCSCLEGGYTQRNYPYKDVLTLLIKIQRNKQSKPYIGGRVVIISEAITPDTDSIDTAAIASLSKQKTASDETIVPEREPRRTKNKQNWEQEKKLHDSMFSKLQQIQQADVQHHCARESTTFESTAPVHLDWVRFPQFCKQPTTSSVSSRKESLPLAHQPILKQRDVKLVGLKLLNDKVTITLPDLLRMSLEIIEFLLHHTSN